MKPRRLDLSRIARTMILCSASMLSGCAGFDFLANEPIRTDRFVLPTDDTDVVGTVQVVVAQKEDTLPDFARRYGLGYNEIVAANPGVDVWLPGDGTKVVLPTQFVLPDAPRTGLVLNLAAQRMFYYPKRKKGEPQVVITHPVGIGREGWRTPQGTLRVAQKIEKPVWRVPASIHREHAARGDRLPAVVKAGPDNPLGEYAMRLNRPSYLIHGTNKPYGIGMRVSHGCIQLYPEDIARLYPEVPVGTSVRIVNQPYLAGWKDDKLYLEAHPPLEEEARVWKGSLKPMEKALGAKVKRSADAVDWGKARAVAREARGLPVAVSPGSPGIDEMLARAPRVPRTPPWADREGGAG
jgi:L,D-transpeptidase ErfK/SrfK